MSAVTPLRKCLLAALLLPALLVGCGESDDRSELEDSVARVESVLGTVSRVLPAIPVDIGTDGRVERIASFPAASVNDFFEDLTGTPLVGRIVFFDEDYLEWFDRSNIQHATIATRPEGLFLMVNGRPLPHLAWNAETLDNLVKVLGRFQDDGSDAFSLMSSDGYEALEVLLPVASRVDMRFDLRFPDLPKVGPKDRRPIALPASDAIDKMLESESLDFKPLESVDVALSFEPYAIEGVEIGWVPALFGFSTVDAQKLSRGWDLGGDGPIDIPRLMLRKDIRERIEREQIRSLAVEMREEGLFARVDGALMPHLAWNESSLTNVSRLLAGLYPLDKADLPDDAAWVPLARATAAMFNDYELGIRMDFPE